MKTGRKVTDYINRLYHSTVYLGMLACFIAMILGIVFSSYSAQAAASIPLKINNKTVSYKGKQYVTSSQGKAVKNQTKYPGLSINNVPMVSYADTFSSISGITNKLSGNTITFEANNRKVTLYLNKKYGYVNGQKKKLAAAPVKVRYITKKKTRIYVPIKFISKNLGYVTKISGKKILISKGIPVQIFGKTKNAKVYTTFKYNGKKHSLNKSIPALSVGGVLYMPAEETLKSVCEFNYSYDVSSQKLKVSNDATDHRLEMVLDQKSASYDGKSITMKNPMTTIQRLDNNQSYLCVPANNVSKKMGLSYETTAYSLKLHDLTYFHWSTTSNDTSKNVIYDVLATYDKSEQGVSFQIKGTLASVMEQTTATRDDKIITLTIPATSSYPLKTKTFGKFGTILDQVDVKVSSGNAVTFTIRCLDSMEYSYGVEGNVLTFHVVPEGTGNKAYQLSIPKPDGVTINQISNEDNYMKNQFQIIMKGNHVGDLSSNPPIVGSDLISGVTVDLNSDGNTVITVSTTTLQGYKIFEKSKYFVVQMGKPSSIYKNIVVVDAGHGNADSGAVSNGTYEKTINLKVAYTYLKKYFQTNAPTTKVYWTRKSDTFMELSGRAAFAKKVEADIFISVHCNSAVNSSANGTEVYYCTSNNKSSFSGITSKSMATIMKNNMISALGTKDRGVKTANYYVCKYNSVPAILIELGFITGNVDYSLLTSTSWQKNASKTIYKTINQYFSTYPTGR